MIHFLMWNSLSVWKNSRNPYITCLNLWNLIFTQIPLTLPELSFLYLSHTFVDLAPLYFRHHFVFLCRTAARNVKLVPLYLPYLCGLWCRTRAHDVNFRTSIYDLVGISDVDLAPLYFRPHSHFRCRSGAHLQCQTLAHDVKLAGELGPRCY